MNNGRVAYDEPFVVVDGLSLRSLAGEIRLAAAAGITGVISRCSHHGETLLPVLRDVVVGAGNVDVLLSRGSAMRKRIPGSSGRRPSHCCWVAGKVWKYASAAVSGPAWIGSNCCNCGETERRVSRSRNVRLTAHPLDSRTRTAGALGGIQTAVRVQSAQILKDTVPHCQAGDFLPRTHGFFRPPRPLVIHEKKRDDPSL